LQKGTANLVGAFEELKNLKLEHDRLNAQKHDAVKMLHSLGMSPNSIENLQFSGTSALTQVQGESAVAQKKATEASEGAFSSKSEDEKFDAMEKETANVLDSFQDLKALKSKRDSLSTSLSWTPCGENVQVLKKKHCKFTAKTAKTACPSDNEDFCVAIVSGAKTTAGDHCCCKPEGVTAKSNGFGKSSTHTASAMCKQQHQKQQDKEAREKKSRDEKTARLAAEQAKMDKMCRTCPCPADVCKVFDPQSRGFVESVCRAEWTCGPPTDETRMLDTGAQCKNVGDECFYVVGQEKKDDKCEKSPQTCVLP